MFATDQFRLRPSTPEDAPNMFLLYGDPELHLITDGEPFLPRHVGQVRARLQKQVTEPITPWSGCWAVQ
ncbi:GNAT family N-acetyltransferase [Micromonospora parastrephiae]|uniref:GNAT family N-acetyltransferase n=1 Tax=Micromonospora parastrephiae TaxID=2806101 RepID=UPI001EE413B8|nr:GNAT family N-acetyltransferase [Micromonospora parastrephiae]